MCSANGIVTRKTKKKLSKTKSNVYCFVFTTAIQFVLRSQFPDTKRCNFNGCLEQKMVGIGENEKRLEDKRLFQRG